MPPPPRKHLQEAASQRAASDRSRWPSAYDDTAAGAGAVRAMADSLSATQLSFLEPCTALLRAKCDNPHSEASRSACPEWAASAVHAALTGCGAPTAEEGRAHAAAVQEGGVPRLVELWKASNSMGGARERSKGGACAGDACAKPASRVPQWNEAAGACDFAAMFSVGAGQGAGLLYADMLADDDVDTLDGYDELFLGLIDDR